MHTLDRLVAEGIRISTTVIDWFEGELNPYIGED